jgi:ketosteroid isomerase-like protein
VSSAEERIDLVRRGYEAYNAGDLEAVLDLFDPEIEVWASPDMLNSGTYRGHEGWLRWISQWNDAWESFHMEVDEIVPVGEHHVVARIHASGRGRGSGVEVVLRDTGYVYDVREGRSVYLGSHSSFEEAIADARDREGLASEGAA